MSKKKRDGFWGMLSDIFTVFLTVIVCTVVLSLVLKATGTFKDLGNTSLFESCSKEEPNGGGLSGDGNGNGGNNDGGDDTTGDNGDDSGNENPPPSGGEDGGDDTIGDNGDDSGNENPPPSGGEDGGDDTTGDDGDDNGNENPPPSGGEDGGDDTTGDDGDDNGNENPPVGGGEDSGDDNTGNQGTTGGGSYYPGGTGSGSTGTESWSEEYHAIESPEQMHFPFEYCFGTDKYGNEGIKIRGNEYFEETLRNNNGVLELPASLDGIGVVGYDSDTFSRNLDILEVHAESGTILGNGMFYNCTNLTTVILGNGCVLQPQTFQGCTSLSNIYLGDFAYVGNAVFYRAGVGTTNCATFDFSTSMTLERFCEKYRENQWEHLLGEGHGAFYGFGTENPVMFLFSDCNILYYSEDEEHETLLKYLENY